MPEGGIVRDMVEEREGKCDVHECAGRDLNPHALRHMALNQKGYVCWLGRMGGVSGRKCDHLGWGTEGWREIAPCNQRLTSC